MAVWELADPLQGRTASAVSFPASESCVLIVHASQRAEFRIVFAPPHAKGLETRGLGEVFCIAVRQHSGTVAAIGFGNPHSLDSAEYRACALPADTGTTFWIVFDAKSGWIVFGLGSDPKLDGALLVLKLAPGDARLRFSHVCASNWSQPVTIRAEISDVAPTCALSQKLLSNQNKFDLQGNCTRIAGATTVCALPGEHVLHAAMLRVHDAVIADPLLRGLVALLPPSSYHMTVMDLCASHVFDAQAKKQSGGGGDEGLAPVDPASWARVPADHVSFMRSLAAKLTRAGISGSREWTIFPMRVTKISVTRVSLSPWDAAAASALAAWRNSVGRALGVGVPPCAGPDGGSDSEYRFHASISYPLFPEWKQRCAAVKDAMRRVDEAAWAGAPTELREALSGPVFLRAPALCYFSDMAAFPPVELS